MDITARVKALEREHRAELQERLVAKVFADEALTKIGRLEKQLKLLEHRVEEAEIEIRRLKSKA